MTRYIIHARNEPFLCTLTTVPVLNGGAGNFKGTAQSRLDEVYCTLNYTVTGSMLMPVDMQPMVGSQKLPHA